MPPPSQYWPQRYGNHQTVVFVRKLERIYWSVCFKHSLQSTLRDRLSDTPPPSASPNCNTPKTITRWTLRPDYIVQASNTFVLCIILYFWILYILFFVILYWWMFNLGLPCNSLWSWYGNTFKYNNKMYDFTWFVKRSPVNL